jgi:hypothetical protein
MTMCMACGKRDRDCGCQGRLQAKVDNWNKLVKVGDLVTVRRDNGDIEETRTRSPAQLLSGHTPVIWLEGIVGCYLLERVTPK